MEIYFKLIHPDVRNSLRVRAERKLQKIGSLIGKEDLQTQAFIEITKATGAHHSEAAWRASINLDAHGLRFHAESVQNSPEKATVRAIDELRSELRTHQARERRMHRRANGLWKSLLQKNFRGP